MCHRHWFSMQASLIASRKEIAQRLSWTWVMSPKWPTCDFDGMAMNRRSTPPTLDWNPWRWRHICCRQGQLICPCPGVGPGWTWAFPERSVRGCSRSREGFGRPAWRFLPGARHRSCCQELRQPSENSPSQQPSSADFLSSLLRSASYCQGWWSAIPHHLKIIIYGNLPLKEGNHLAGTEKRNIETT